MDVSKVVLVVRQLRDLSADPLSRPYIARRGVLPGIVDFLRHSSAEVVLLAAEALRNLSQHPDNLELIRSQPRLMDTLVGLKGRSDVADIVADCLGRLQRPSAAAPPAPSAVEGRAEKHFVAAKVSRLFLSSVRQRVEEGVLRIERGIISFTIDVATGAVRIYTYLPDAALLQTLRTHGVDATGLEREAADVSTENSAPAGPAPQYLSPGKGRKRLAQARALLLRNDADDSLVSRMARQQPPQKDEAPGGVLSRVASWFR